MSISTRRDVRDREHKRDTAAGIGERVACAFGFPALGPRSGGGGVFVLCALGAVYVVGVHLFVFLFLLLGEVFPVLALFGGEALPLLAYGFGEVGLALFLCGGVGVGVGVGRGVVGLLTLFAAFATEEDEGVLWAFDVIVVALPGTAFCVSACGRFAPLV
jgi:hypothetical protein